MYSRKAMLTCSVPPWNNTCIHAAWLPSLSSRLSSHSTHKPPSLLFFSFSLFLLSQTILPVSSLLIFFRKKPRWFDLNFKFVSSYQSLNPIEFRFDHQVLLFIPLESKITGLLSCSLSLLLLFNTLLIAFLPLSARQDEPGVFFQ